MGLNNFGALRVVFDIETAPLLNAADYLDLSNVSAPANWKDPEKIAEYIAEAKAKEVDRAALDPDLCRVVAIGWMQEDWNEPVVMTEGQATEAQMLFAFWEALDGRVTVGKNNVQFDLPVLLRRSLYLGVQAPMLNLHKYRSNHIDLQAKLSFDGAFKWRTLEFYCKRFGIDDGSDDTITGKDIGAMVKDGNWMAVRYHCRCDVLKTKALAERLGLLKQQPLMQEAAF